MYSFQWTQTESLACKNPNTSISSSKTAICSIKWTIAMCTPGYSSMMKAPFTHRLKRSAESMIGGVSHISALCMLLLTFNFVSFLNEAFCR